MSSDQSSFQTIGEGLIKAPENDADRKEISDRLGKMIDYAIKRHDWYEDQRSKTLSLGLALLGLSGFLVGGLLSQSVESLPFFWAFATLTLLSILITAVWIILQYGWGSQLTYTHRALADIRSWYFAYTIKSDGPDPDIHDADKDEENKIKLIANWEAFLERWSEFRNRKNAFVVEDLQQVFVLFLLQNIKRQSLRDMLKPAYIGGLAIALCLAVTIMCAGLRV